MSEKRKKSSWFDNAKWITKNLPVELDRPHTNKGMLYLRILTRKYNQLNIHPPVLTVRVLPFLKNKRKRSFQNFLGVGYFLDNKSF